MDGNQGRRRAHGDGKRKHRLTEARDELAGRVNGKSCFESQRGFYLHELSWGQRFC